MSAWSEHEPVHQQMKTERQREEAAWRDLARFLRPDNQSFNATDKKDRDGQDDPFDSTPLYAADDFAGGMFVKAINPAERWFSLGIDNTDLAEFKPVKKWLWDYTSAIITSLNPAYDNFYLSAPAWFGDLAGFGNGFLWQEEMVGTGQIMSNARPIGENYKMVDANGNTVRRAREFRLTGRQAKIEFGRAAPAMRDDEEAVFIHCVWRNENYQPGMLGPRGKPWASCVVSPDKRDFYQERLGYNEDPCHEIQWNMRSGRSWATGPGHNALADMRGLDEAARSTIIGMQFEAEPTMWAANEDILTTADMIPGGLVYGEALQGGRPPVAAIKRGENPQLALAYIQDLRMQVKKAFRFGLTDILQARPQMTAEEVQGYKADELKLLAPNLTRIYRGVGGFIARRANILGRIPNMIAAPPPELQGQPITPKFVSPFTKAQKAERAQGVLGWVNTKAAMYERTKTRCGWTTSISMACPACCTTR
ncbi:portal protein [Rhodopseudomonas sp. P2A-2r]|uniref:portal protein n=1 Tax=Rhodopseudomonas sp. P2A-2r TaxID=2991972 RepID=UPI002234A767|nr:portal protein [Rhodopseudomonas sp. P2A-2r]UZE47921.1 portal protein [Rhodopseudomonas sp. P2A-2r]